MAHTETVASSCRIVRRASVIQDCICSCPDAIDFADTHTYKPHIHTSTMFSLHAAHVTPHTHTCHTQVGDEGAVEVARHKDAQAVVTGEEVQGVFVLGGVMAQLPADACSSPGFSLLPMLSTSTHTDSPTSLNLVSTRRSK